jgi:hypothetical protein
MNIPSSPEQLSADFLGRALGTPVDAFRVEPFGAGSAIIGLVARVHLDAASGPASIIAKFPSPVAANRAVARTYDMYGREVAFYQSVAPGISLRTPGCYFAAIDDDRSDFLLLLEDLGHLRVGDQVAGCSLADAHLVIDGIARLHASTWQTQPAATVVRHDNAAQREGMIAGFRLGWPAVLNAFPDLVPETRRQIGDAVPAAVPGLLRAMCREPTCIAHADVRLDNVLFDKDGIVLVDWQSVCVSAPEQDLAYFVTQSLPDEVRTTEDWVAIYHAALTRLGVDYPLDLCRARYRICALYLLCFAVIIAGTLDLSNERGKALGRTLLGNAMRSLEALDAFSLLDDPSIEVAFS